MPIVPSEQHKDKPNPKYIQLYEEFGLVFSHESGDQVIADDCPFCGGEKFYVNRNTGQYDCKHGQCQATGNAYTFITHMHGRLLEQTTTEHYATCSVETLGVVGASNRA